ncbi:MAG: 16S rRNA (cytidine(1402)-2'-O)-methyltransferase, partial [Alphaproteobacteria bacterium]
VVGPPAVAPVPTGDDLDARLRALLTTHSLRDAVALLAGETGNARRALYERALGLTRGERGGGDER